MPAANAAMERIEKRLAGARRTNTAAMSSKGLEDAAIPLAVGYLHYLNGHSSSSSSTLADRVLAALQDDLIKGPERFALAQAALYLGAHEGSVRKASIFDSVISCPWIDQVPEDLRAKAKKLGYVDTDENAPPRTFDSESR